MSTQISVRLNDRVVAELDALVASGAAKSRAELVESALERELRRRLYEREVEMLMAQKASGVPEDDDLAGLAEWARTRTYPDLD
ncbi:hypothetical protein N802_12840 [Knoellia sinensis KCTC 19936]|uniref:Ribbon-helix-helix protein CopG domain-containing protein n=1 Tax=Knoellia sinensis KCTC 19936 TaxID=1385520 RepID=A0A0A0J9X2_9MICO|nr:ribbon-helix-helix domain-containing protein [Knoellia sinensis]KGN34245.1 hypothetical protein N802_12840 [Knoellia sinensis KCTC 19936]